ncbi:hypothetical protein BH10CYA1_BH10CYA1_32630 [soil metagenome]
MTIATTSESLKADKKSEKSDENIALSQSMSDATRTLYEARLNKSATTDSNPKSMKDLPSGKISQDGSISFLATQEQSGRAGAGVDKTRDSTKPTVKEGPKIDGKGHVYEVDYADGQSRKFRYSSKGTLNQITDLNGQVSNLDSTTGKWVYEKQQQGTIGAAGIGLNLASYSKQEDYVNPKVSRDGTLTYSTSDGMDKTFTADGSSVVKNSKENSITKTNADGQVTQVDYSNGQNRQFEYTKDANGKSHLSKFTDSDCKTYTLKDSKWLSQDGCDSGITNVAVDADGKVSRTSKEGQITATKTDLSTTIENPNHSLLTQKADGQVAQINYGNGKIVKFEYSTEPQAGQLNKIINTDGSTTTLDLDGKWKDQCGVDTGITDVRMQADGAYTFIDKDNHMVLNDTDGKQKMTSQTTDQIKQSATQIHEAENNKLLWLVDRPDSGQINDIVQNMSPTDRYVLEQQYQQMYGTKLTDDLTTHLGSKYAAQANEMLYVANLQEDAAKYIPDTPGSDGKSQRQAYLDNMNTFIERAHEKGMSDEQIAGTFAASQKLLEAQDGKVNEKLRVQLAQQIMDEAAHPERIDQGHHLSCTLSDVESRTWTNRPDVMANTVAEVALNGYYTAPDGKQITIPAQNFIPDGEAIDNPPKDNARSFASQLIQATLCNDIVQRETPPKYYTQLPPTQDASSGEFWTDADGKPLAVSDGEKKGKPWAFDGLNSLDIAKQIKRLTGDDGTVFRQGYTGDDLVGFNGEKELQEKIQQAKKDGKMPIIIDVAHDDPLFGGSKPLGTERKGTNHVVCIDAYNADTGMVHINNSWGAVDDKWVPIHDLYQATV